MAESLKELITVLRENNASIKSGNDLQEYILVENIDIMTDIRDVLMSLKDKFTSFSSDYRDNIEFDNQKDQMSLLAAREAANEDGRDGGQSSSGTVEDNTPELEKLEGSTVGALVTIAALTKFFGMDAWVRMGAAIGSLDGAFTSIVNTLGNVAKAVKGKLTSAVQFLDHMTNNISKRFDRLVDFFKRIGSTIGKVASGAKSFLTSSKKVNDVFAKIVKGFSAVLGPMGTLLKKIALPLTVIFAIIDGITGFVKEFAETGSILSGIRGAITGILDGLVGTLIRLAGDIVAFIPDILGLDAIAETIKNFAGNIAGGLIESIGGLVDVVMGLLSFDLGRITDGLGSIIGGLFDAFTEAVMFPINMVINFVRDIFGFSEEDAPPFRIQDLIGDAVTSIKDWFTDLFTFEWPSFDFNPGAVLAKILPAPDSWAAKLVPDALYEAAGINPDTGEALETPDVKEKPDRSIAGRQARELAAMERNGLAEGVSKEDGDNARAQLKQGELKTRKDTSGLEQGQLKTRKDTSGLKQGELKTRNDASGLEQGQLKTRKDTSGMEQGQLKTRKDESGLEQGQLKARKDESGLEQGQLKTPASKKKATGLMKDVTSVADSWLEDPDVKELQDNINKGAEAGKAPYDVIGEMADEISIDDPGKYSMAEQELVFLAKNVLGIDDIWAVPTEPVKLTPPPSPKQSAMEVADIAPTEKVSPPPSLKQTATTSPLATAAATVGKKKTPGLIKDVQDTAPVASLFAEDGKEIRAAIIAGAKHEDKKDPAWVIMEMANGDMVKEEELRLIAMSELDIDNLYEIPEWAMPGAKPESKGKQSVQKTNEDKSGLKKGELKTRKDEPGLELGQLKTPASKKKGGFVQAVMDTAPKSMLPLAQSDIELAEEIDKGAKTGKTPYDVIVEMAEEISKDDAGKYMMAEEELRFAATNILGIDDLYSVPEKAVTPPSKGSTSVSKTLSNSFSSIESAEGDVGDVSTNIDQSTTSGPTSGPETNFFSETANSVKGLFDKSVSGIMEAPSMIKSMLGFGSDEAGGEQSELASKSMSTFLPSEFSSPQGILGSIADMGTGQMDLMSQAIPTPLQSLAAPGVNAATKALDEVKTASTQIIAPVTTTDASVTTTNNVNNVNNTTITSPSARSTDPTFMRLQNSLA